MPHSSKSVQKPPILLWRTHSCVPRRDSSRRSGQFCYPSAGNLRTLTDTKCRSGKRRASRYSPVGFEDGSLARGHTWNDMPPMPHSSKSVQKPPILLWRTHSCVPRRDSSRRSGQFCYSSAGNLRTLTDTKCRSGKLRSRATSPRPSNPLVVVPNGMPTARHLFKCLCFHKGLLRRTYSFDLGGRPSPPFFHRRRAPTRSAAVDTPPPSRRLLRHHAAPFSPVQANG